MGENKTVAGDASVEAFIAGVDDPRRREEAAQIDALMRRATGEGPRMWGPSIVGYGAYDYAYASGRSGTSMRAGFSPRKGQHVVYLMGEWGDAQAEASALLARLGKHSLGASCLNIKRLGDVDMGVLEELVRLNWRVMAERWPAAAGGG